MSLDFERDQTIREFEEEQVRAEHEQRDLDHNEEHEINEPKKKSVKKLPTIAIKGKEYVLVKDRIIAFNDKFPEGSITTQILNDDDKSVVVKATISTHKGMAARTFTGHSEAFRGVGQMGNVPIEVAETSAVGRALAFLGIGVIDSIASADEVNKASVRRQDAPGWAEGSQDGNIPVSSKLASQKQKEMLMSLCLEKGVKTTQEEVDVMSSKEAYARINALLKLPKKAKKIVDELEVITDYE